MAGMMPRNKTGMPWADYLNARVSQRKRALPKTHGLQCVYCHDIHPYNGPQRLEIDYGYFEKRIYIFWVCPVTGNPIRAVSYGSDPETTT